MVALSIVKTADIIILSIYVHSLLFSSPRLYLFSFPPSTLLHNRIKQRAKKKPRNSKEEEDMCCDDDCRCRPLGFLLGLPFAFLSLIICLIGIVVWIVGLFLSCICPCCFCVTVLVEFALGLIRAPISVMKWFTEQIPC